MSLPLFQSLEVKLYAYLYKLIRVWQTYYEDVGEDSIYIRGAFFVGASNTKMKQIDFFVLDPQNKVVVSKRKSEEGIFRFNTTMAGTYTFVFSNMKDRKSKKDVTIALHTPGNDELYDQEERSPLDDIAPEDIIGEEDVGNIRKYMKSIYSEVRSIATEAKFSNFRQHSHNDAIKSNNNYNFYMIIG